MARTTKKPPPKSTPTDTSGGTTTGTTDTSGGTTTTTGGTTTSTGGTSSTSGSGTTTGTTITVSTAAELLTALQNAKGGESIVLKSGSYGTLSLVDQKNIFTQYAADVTIKSEDPAHPAVLTGLDLHGVGNLKLDGIKFDYTALAGAATYAAPFHVTACANVTITNSLFDGDIAKGLNALDDGFGTGIGLQVSGSSNITVTNNEFLNWYRAGTFNSTSNLTVSGNNVHDMASDGFDFADVDNVIISKNHIHDFFMSPNTTAHPDMIQFWTSGTTSPSTNVQIFDNYLDMGAGVPVQSIFIRNQLVDQGLAGTEMFYQNFVISNNLIIGGQSHGITVGEISGLVVDNNTLLQHGTIADGGTVSVPQINIAATATGVTVTDNVLAMLNALLNSPPAGWVVSNNVLAQRDDSNAANYIGNLYADALDVTSPHLSDYMVAPGSIIDIQHAGSNLAQSLADGETVGVIINKNVNDGGCMIQSLDASNLFTKTGKVDMTGAKVVWDFGDGTTGTGVAASHVYEQAGLHTATATITLASGSVVHVDKTFFVASDRMLDMNFEGGAKDLSPIANAVSLGTATFEAGADGDAIRLNGGVVKVSAGLDFVHNNEYTLLADFKKDASNVTGGGRLVYFGGSFVVTLGADSVDVAFNTDTGAKSIKTTGIGITDADWHKLALTFSGDTGTAILYLDGHQIGSLSGLQGQIQVGTSNTDLFLGGPFGGSFGGLIDNVHFVADALTGSEIATSNPLDAWTKTEALSNPTLSDYLTTHPSPFSLL